MANGQWLKAKKESRENSQLSTLNSQLRISMSVHPPPSRSLVAGCYCRNRPRRLPRKSQILVLCISYCNLFFKVKQLDCRLNRDIRATIIVGYASPVRHNTVDIFVEVRVAERCPNRDIFFVSVTILVRLGCGSDSTS